MHSRSRPLRSCWAGRERRGEYTSWPSERPHGPRAGKPRDVAPAVQRQEQRRGRRPGRALHGKPRLLGRVPARRLGRRPRGVPRHMPPEKLARKRRRSASPRQGKRLPKLRPVRHQRLAPARQRRWWPGRLQTWTANAAPSATMTPSGRYLRHLTSTGARRRRDRAGGSCANDSNNTPKPARS